MANPYSSPIEWMNQRVQSSLEDDAPGDMKIGKGVVLGNGYVEPVDFDAFGNTTGPAPRYNSFDPQEQARLKQMGFPLTSATPININNDLLAAQLQSQGLATDSVQPATSTPVTTGGGTVLIRLPSGEVRRVPGNQVPSDSTILSDNRTLPKTEAPTTEVNLPKTDGPVTTGGGTVLVRLPTGEVRRVPGDQVPPGSTILSDDRTTPGGGPPPDNKLPTEVNLPKTDGPVTTGGGKDVPNTTLPDDPKNTDWKGTIKNQGMNILLSKIDQWLAGQRVQAANDREFSNLIRTRQWLDPQNINFLTAQQMTPFGKSRLLTEGTVRTGLMTAAASEAANRKKLLREGLLAMKQGAVLTATAGLNRNITPGISSAGIG